MGTLAGQPSGWAAGARFARLMHRTSNPIVIALLRSPLHWPLSRSVLLITVRGRRTGRPYTLPVVYAKIGSTILIVPGDPEHKTWWRNLTDGPTPVEVLHGDGWSAATAEVLRPGENGHSAALAAYRRRWPRFESPAGQPVVVIRASTSGIPRVSRPLESVG